jgi:CD109 antigen
MTTFTPFFLSLNLPYSVIRGEEFALAVTVFNYLPTNQEVNSSPSSIIEPLCHSHLQVVVTLPHSPIRAFGTHRSANELVERYESVTRKLNVPANDAANAHFWIVPKKLGQISLKILAQSPAAADAVEKKLLVEVKVTDLWFPHFLTSALIEG